VEDEDSQRASIVLALQNSIPDIVVIAVRDGTEALDFLLGRGAWTERLGEDPPRLILMDLSMPGETGFSVLAQLRALEAKNALTLTPVVIFTDSQAPGDILMSYRCGANSFIKKPLDFARFQAVVESVGQYWIKQNFTPA
jgi:two-component system response regulator